ncbi:MAG: hypothetical protein JWR69_495 [Pedosphaera sp.]|nr:hypothetical protein [Pedosphaera sp.]
MPIELPPADGQCTTLKCSLTSVITRFGTRSGISSVSLMCWILAAGLFSLAAVLIIGNAGKTQAPPDPGLTTEVAMLLMFGVGA